MSNKKYDLIGIGSAIVDILSYKPENFLTENDLPKGSMKLIDFDSSRELYAKLGAAAECSGGSTANTISGYGLLGGNAAFIGKTRNDYLGKVFKQEISKVGVNLITDPTTEGTSTSKCIIIVTEEELPSGKKRVERTMATYLDFDVAVDVDDIKEDIIGDAEIIFFEGYLFDNESSKHAVLKAIDIAKENRTKIALTLSDKLCIERHRDELLKIVKEDADFIFCNEGEMLALFEGQDLRKILHILLDIDATFCVTKGESGSTIVRNKKIYDIEPEKVDDVYDVTGAGDLYASGFLFGILNDYKIEDCGKLASLCAAEVIKDIGARPVRGLKTLIEKV